MDFNQAVETINGHIDMIYWSNDDPEGARWAAHFLKQAKNKI